MGAYCSCSCTCSSKHKWKNDGRKVRHPLSQFECNTVFNFCSLECATFVCVQLLLDTLLNVFQYGVVFNEYWRNKLIF